MVHTSDTNMAIDTKPAELSPETVPLGTGLPTREELQVHYPANFTWHQMKVFVNSGYVDSFRICQVVRISVLFTMMQRSRTVEEEQETAAAI